MSTKKNEDRKLRERRDKPSESGPTDDSRDEELLSDDVSPSLLKAFRSIVRQELDRRLEPIENSIKELTDIRNRVDAAEAAIEDTSARLETLTAVSLPSLTDQLNSMLEGLALQTLELDIHRRKWNLCIHGLKGVAREPAETTRAHCVAMAKQYLQVPNAAPSDFSAAHRLGGSMDSGIIVRFNDISKRDAWLAGARGLRAHPDRVSISQDLPPKIRPLKAELLNIRKAMPEEVKTRARIRHLPAWPFVELTTPGNDPIRPSTTKKDILKSITETELKLIV